MIPSATTIMATAINTAIVTATEGPNAITRRPGHSQANGSDTTSKPAVTSARGTQKKYRHVAAVHSRPRTSCLSHDSPTTPSFIGFRNLMVIVLSEFTISLLLFQLDCIDLVLTEDIVVGNLRLMIENFNKVGNNINSFTSLQPDNYSTAS
jgi:diacylglycerol O-acyltransferase-1